MSTSVSMSHSAMELEVIKTYGKRVCVFGNIGNYPALVIQMPPEQARQLAADLIAAADRIESLSPTPPADPLAASLPAAGGAFSSEVTPEVFGWVYGDAFVEAKFWTADEPPKGWTPVYTAAQAAEIEALRVRTAVTMGVGTGDGKLFVHGDCDSIKAAQAIVLQRDALRAEVDAAKDKAEFYRTERNKNQRKAERLTEALLCVLPYVEHSDNCGDHDAYNNAEVPSCGCGLDGIREHADALLRDQKDEVTP